MKNKEFKVEGNLQRLQTEFHNIIYIMSWYWIIFILPIYAM